MADTTTKDEKKLQDYQAHCHCGAVRLTFRIGPLETETIISCNCSICTRNGYILVYPQADTLVIEQGEAQLSSYVFGNKEKPHRFCACCGSSMFIDFTQSPNEVLKTMMAVNLRMVPGIEDRLGELVLKKVDGKTKLLPAYEAGK